MSIPSGSTMRTTLETIFDQAIDARERYLSAARTLTNLGVNRIEHSAHVVDIVEKTMQAYFEKLCKGLSATYSQGTPATIQLDARYYTFASYRETEGQCDRPLSYALRHRFTYCDDKPQHEQKEVIQTLLEAIPYDDIEASLLAQADKLRDVGMRIYADRCVDRLNIDAKWRVPKITSRYILCEISASGYNWDVAKEINELHQSLSTIARKSAIDFGFVLSDLRNAIQALSYDGMIPSRTRFGENSDHLSIICFKDKYQLRFSHAAFDAITAFVNLYGSDASIQAVNALSAKLSQAA